MELVSKLKMCPTLFRTMYGVDWHRAVEWWNMELERKLQQQQQQQQHIPQGRT